MEIKLWHKIALLGVLGVIAYFVWRSLSAKLTSLSAAQNAALAKAGVIPPNSATPSNQSGTTGLMGTVSDPTNDADLSALYDQLNQQYQSNPVSSNMGLIDPFTDPANYTNPV